MSTEPNALAVREQNAVTTMSIASFLSDEGIWNRANSMGKALMKTKYLGQGTSEFGATMAVITMAKNNLDPVEFSRAYNMINDKPEMKPNYALGLFKQAGGRYKMNQVDEDACDMEFTAPDGTYAHITVTMERMLKTDVPWTYDKNGNRILKSNWANHPDDMLFARCTGKALRRVWPEHMGGMYMAGEIEHDDDVRKVVRATQISEEDVKARIAKAKVEPVAGVPAPEMPVSEKKDEKPSEEIQDVDFEIEKHSVEKVEHPAESAIDTNVCPIEGPFLGVRFDEMEPDTLTFLLDPSVPERHPELTTEHVENVRRAMERFTEAE